MTVITIIVGSFACLSVGALLIGIACVKEAFTSSVTRRYEAGSIAVEITTRGTTRLCEDCVRRLAEHAETSGPTAHERHV